MSVKDRISEDLKSAMKARDKDRTSALRMILSELKYAQAAASMSVELPEEEAVKVVAAYHKRLTKSVDDYPPGERREQLYKELAIVEEYLPKKADLGEINRVIDAVLAGTTERNFGPLMKEVLSRLGSSADGKLVSQSLKSRLSAS